MSILKESWYWFGGQNHVMRSTSKIAKARGDVVDIWIFQGLFFSQYKYVSSE
jgi:hypothetical protein